MNEGLGKKIVGNPGLLISIVILLGFLFAPYEHVNVQAISDGTATFGGGKAVRLVSVIVAGLFAATILMVRGLSILRSVFIGSIFLFLLFALLGEATVVFSPLRTLTLFKATELVLLVVVMAIVISSQERAKATIFYIKSIFGIYAIFTASALIETLVIGTGDHKQLVGVTPFLSTMMQSSYPPMAGNALGYLGALVALFGLYLFDSHDIKGKKRRVISSAIIILGVLVLVLSYTRSVLVFFLISVFLLIMLNRQYVRAIILIFLVIAALLTPTIQDRVVEHMRRGMSDEQLTTLSGRTTFWSEILSQSSIKIVVGQGFGTASKLSGDSAKLSKVGNAHNSLAEIIMSSGVVGALLWLVIILRISYRVFFKRVRAPVGPGDDSRRFHNFLRAVLLLSLMRTLMNSTFVYLDVFSFVLISLILYSEVVCGSARSTAAPLLARAKRRDGLLSP